VEDVVAIYGKQGSVLAEPETLHASKRDIHQKPHSRRGCHAYGFLAYLCIRSHCRGQLEQTKLLGAVPGQTLQSCLLQQ
jgi:hypothetical protein